MDPREKIALLLNNTAEKLKGLYTDYDRTRFTLSAFSFLAGLFSFAAMISSNETHQMFLGPMLIAGGFVSWQKFQLSKGKAKKRDDIHSELAKDVKAIDNGADEEYKICIEHCFDMRNMRDKTDRTEEREILFAGGKIACGIAESNKVVEATQPTLNVLVQPFINFLSTLDPQTKRAYSLILLIPSLLCDIYDMYKYYPIGTGRISEQCNALIKMAKKVKQKGEHFFFFFLYSK